MRCCRLAVLERTILLGEAVFISFFFLRSSTMRRAWPRPRPRRGAGGGGLGLEVRVEVLRTEGRPPPSS